MNKIILDILGRQHNLNIMFCGAGYSKNVSEKTGKKIVFGKGLLDETLELMNSVSWKHWDKGNKHDKHNMVTECIDAIHFLNAEHGWLICLIYLDALNLVFVFHIF